MHLYILMQSFAWHRFWVKWESLCQNSSECGSLWGWMYVKVMCFCHGLKNQLACCYCVPVNSPSPFLTFSKKNFLKKVGFEWSTHPWQTGRYSHHQQQPGTGPQGRVAAWQTAGGPPPRHSPCTCPSRAPAFTRPPQGGASERSPGAGRLVSGSLSWLWGPREINAPGREERGQG